MHLIVHLMHCYIVITTKKLLYLKTSSTTMYYNIVNVFRYNVYLINTCPCR